MTAVEVLREPLFRRAPSCRKSFGDLARRVGVELGLAPDDEQQAALDDIFAERAPGEPASRHACIVGARQNIKTSTLVIAAATDLLVLGVPGAVWTAHQSKTSTKSYEDLLGRLLRSDEYAPLVDYRGGRGEERIFLLDDPEVGVEYRARSGGSGRGFTTSRLTLDEALYLRAGDMGALMPTMLTRRDAQVRYGSSGGFASSEVLRSLRKRAREGSDPRLFYVEYGAERRNCTEAPCSHEVGTDGCALDDRELWWQANSALWCGRIDEENILDLRTSMPSEEFAREVLVWWDEPQGGAGTALDEDLWKALADPGAERGVRPVFAVATAPDRSWSAIAVAWRRGDGHVQVMVPDYRPGAAWVAARAGSLGAKWGGDVVLDTAARGLIPGAEEVTQAVQAQAHNALADAVDAGSVRHGNEAALNTAVRGAQWRALGDTRVLDRKGGTDISPLASAALALHRVLSRPAQQLAPVAVAAPPETAALSSMTF